MKSPTESGTREANGYAMAGLLVAMGVMAVTMSVAMPVWKQVAQREKEEELIFRGQQYAHAIGLFQRKFGNAMPPNVNVLIEQRFLRKKYKDPITNDDFSLLTMGQAAVAGRTPAASLASSRPGQSPQPAGRNLPTSRSAAPTAASPGSPEARLMNAFIGVVSKSKDQSIRLYQGKNHYNEWAFIHVPQTQTPGATVAGSTVPGQRAQPSVPGSRGHQTVTHPLGGRGRGAIAPAGRGGGFSPFPQTSPSPRGRSGA